jgi:hypothetical protein
LLKEYEWEEGHEDEDESFRAVSTDDRSYTHNEEAYREIIFQRRSGNGLLLKMLR